MWDASATLPQLTAATLSALGRKDGSRSRKGAGALLAALSTLRRLPRSVLSESSLRNLLAHATDEALNVWSGILLLATTGANQATAEAAAIVILEGLGYAGPTQGNAPTNMDKVWIPAGFRPAALEALPKLLGKLSSSWGPEALRTIVRATTHDIAQGLQSLRPESATQLAGALADALAMLGHRNTTRAEVSALRHAAHDAVLSDFLPTIVNSSAVCDRAIANLRPRTRKDYAEDCQDVDNDDGGLGEENNTDWLGSLLDCLSALPPQKVSGHMTV